MLQSCQRCGKIHEIGKCTVKKKYRPKESTETTRFRSSAVWTKKRKQILERDGYACKICATNGKINSYRLQVHHIEPLADNFERRTDDSNLLTVCESCHTLAHSYDYEKRKTLHNLTTQTITEILNKNISPPH